MNISAPTITVIAAICFASVALHGCQPAVSPINRSAVSTSPTPDKIDPIAIEAELTKLERGWADASKNHDVSAANQILADDVIITYMDGSTGTKGDELKVIASGTITADSWELFDPKVTVLNADAAFISGHTVIKNGKQREPNMKPVDLSGEYRFTDVYARRNGKWQAVASQITKILNPGPAVSPSPSKTQAAVPKTSPSAVTSPKKVDTVK